MNLARFTSWLFVLLSAASSGCAHGYRSAPIEGQVVDAETKQPLEGVVVAADWPLYGGPYHYGPVGELLLMETTTDSQGHYRLEAWGPISTDKGELPSHAPHLYFLKRGYAPQLLQNRLRPPYWERPDPWVSDWYGKTVEIKKLTNNPPRNELAAGQDIWSAIGPNRSKPCGWADAPRAAAVLILLGQDLRKRRISNSFPDADSFRNENCRLNPDAILGDYLDVE